MSRRVSVERAAREVRVKHAQNAGLGRKEIEQLESVSKHEIEQCIDAQRQAGDAWTDLLIRANFDSMAVAFQEYVAGCRRLMASDKPSDFAAGAKAFKEILACGAPIVRGVLSGAATTVNVLTPPAIAGAPQDAKALEIKALDLVSAERLALLSAKGEGGDGD